MLVTRPQNGFGISYGQRLDNTTIEHDPWFNNAMSIMDQLVEQQTLVLGGEPGAGKSHITADLFWLAYNNTVPTAMLSAHINAGSMRGRDATSELFDDAANAEERVLFILDNLDYMLYTGGLRRRRTNKKTDEYARFLDEKLQKLHSAGHMILATVHSEEWRVNHSSEGINAKHIFNNLVEILGGQTDFSGAVTRENATRLLLRRGLPRELARRISVDLERQGELTFRQAHHIDTGTYLRSGIIVAANEVNRLKDEKIQGGA